MSWLPAAFQVLLLLNQITERKRLELQKLARQQTNQHYKGKQWEHREKSPKSTRGGQRRLGQGKPSEGKLRCFFCLI